MDHQTAPSSLVAALGPNEHDLPGTSVPKVAAPLDRQSLLTLIREQLEFCFSEYNLPKDVFLLKQIEKDKTKEGYVSLKVIAGFPNMKRLTHDLGAIREAVENSEIVVLSPDGLSVKRKIPVILPEDTTEKRTLYVTRLPKDCDRESLMLVFSEYGTVIRLDLPMDKKTGEHKGMAFVEFQTEEELRKALEDFATSTKYKMVVKPFKSRNSKETKPLESIEDGSDEEKDDIESNKEKRLSGGKGSNKRNSKEKEQIIENRRNSQEIKENHEKRRSGEGTKRSSKEIKDKRNSKEESEKRRSGESKPQDNPRDKRYSKDAREYAKQQQSNRKDPNKRTSKEFANNMTGREVPSVPDSAYDNSFNQARARGAKVQRNSDKMKEEDSDSISIRPIERPKFKKEMEMDKPQFVPIRNPYGPIPDDKGFGLGRGKLLQK